MSMRVITLAVGVAAGALCAAQAQAQAEPNDGATFAFSASTEETDLMSLEYGGFGDKFLIDPLIEQNDSAAGTRFDASISGLDFGVFDMNADAYLRGGYSDVSGGANADFATSAFAAVPTGFVGDSSQPIADSGGGSLLTARDIEQREGEIAAGLVFAAYHGFTPRVELNYRRSEIDQTISVDRLGVTPMLEEFATDTSAVNSDCAELAFGVAKTMPLGPNWSFVADASAGVGYCSHDLEGRFDFVSTPSTYTSVFEDSFDGVSARGAVSAELIWQLTDMVGLGLNAYARMESDAPYIAYPTYALTNGNVEVFGAIRLETESRAAYGAGLSLRVALP